MSFQQPPQQPGYPQYPPNTYYPPEQPPATPPKKSRKKLWLIIGGVILVMALCGGVMNALGLGGSPSSQSVSATATTATQATSIPTDTPVPTPKPTQPPKWTTTQTFTGSGEKTTATFQTSGDWKLVWTAQASSCCEAFFGVSVYGSDGSLVDSGTDATIPAGKKMTDSNEEHTGAGSFYLKVYAGIAWTVQVQELK